MAPLLALFLVALVGLPLAQALDCHVCAYNGENCFNPMRCPSMVTCCRTSRPPDFTPTKMKVSKSCVPSCFETVYDGYSKHASTTAEGGTGAAVLRPGCPPSGSTRRP
ncbi:PREDICTED: ly-6/neurotoxin-like protein 1 [Myotis davidii]|uniref:ly-6/neurotoxin-like protein 1 n=1 Tax=Myotis davidii TaxID=225400 RepID=UPI00076769A8|nr:PREDICTED: ly-6/neurotoxin-like protein 1 [Myotis davidii]